MTKNPRITVTLQPGVHVVLKRLSALAGNSQSGLVGELLEDSLPVFERMVRVLEAANAAKDSFKVGMSASLDAAQTKLEGQLGLALEAMDEGFRPILEEAEAVRRRESRASREKGAAVAARPALRASTPMSNRGVTPHPEKAKKARKGHGRGAL